MQKTVTISDTNIEVKDSYSRIEVLRFDYPSRVFIQVNTYESSEAKRILDEHTYEVFVGEVDEDFEGINIPSIADISAEKAYELIMSLPEWSGSVKI